MTTLLNPYIGFKDTTRDAMEFYQSVLGGELNLFTFGDMGDADGADANLVMHSSLVTPAGYTIFAADTPSSMPFQEGSQITISLSGPAADDAELRRYWDGLSADGTVTLPLGKQTWGDVFGMFTDRFGIAWMVNIGAE